LTELTIGQKIEMNDFDIVIDLKSISFNSKGSIVKTLERAPSHHTNRLVALLFLIVSLPSHGEELSTLPKLKIEESVIPFESVDENDELPTDDSNVSEDVSPEEMPNLKLTPGLQPSPNPGPIIPRPIPVPFPPLKPSPHPVEDRVPCPVGPNMIMYWCKAQPIGHGMFRELFEGCSSSIESARRASLSHCQSLHEHCVIETCELKKS
jgi:hypothetical protein